MKNPKQFWNSEYKKATHLTLSSEPSSDLEKFTRWAGRGKNAEFLRLGAVDGTPIQVIDLGCGNGRNLIYLAKEFGCQGVGYDSSEQAISQAKIALKNATNEAGASLPATFKVSTIQSALKDVASESVDLVLDMMTSHVLHDAERAAFFAEIARVLKPGGYLFFKTFFAEGDAHAKRLLAEHGTGESGSYIHPRIGAYEHVWQEDEIYRFFDKDFEVKKFEKSHKHILHGKAYKRRTVTVYLERKMN